MIYNIIDHRSRPYLWREVNAIVEATSHDNACEDADHERTSDADITYDQLENVTVQEAVAWASAEPSAVTLYLYDKGAGTT
ncbi:MULTISPECIES: hypothetical protein [unclassified Sphingomonas]|uniref:hypothetical protein n=1 Tax=unclassified Sphingomonas TaxID=196159 RepID=UPI0006F9B375|nr:MULTISPECIES: hypothetical protein [unclassified Sphingomonas]KQM24875.1 hypothetical protein ASE58_15940 [Sphingomonas sp. Leaf9]KQM42533.1 hypothetical protein ASE57_15940 [Sphingomonas sp. Leaf11]